MDKIPLNNKSTDFTINGKCSKCGQCCSNFIPLTEDEVKRLKKIVRKRKLKPHRNHVVNAMYDATCPFLNDENKCRIYEDRPMICKFFKCDKKGASLAEAKKLLKADVVNVRVAVFDSKEFNIWQ